MEVVPFQPQPQAGSGPYMAWGLIAVILRFAYKAIEGIDRAADNMADLFGDAAEELKDGAVQITSEAASAATLAIQLLKGLAVVWFVANAVQLLPRLIAALKAARAYTFRVAPAAIEIDDQDLSVESDYVTYGPINLPPTPRLLFPTTRSNASSPSRAGTPSPQRRPRSTSPSPSNASSSSSRIAQGGPES